MSEKLDKSHQLRRISLIIGLIFTCTCVLPLNSPIAMAASNNTELQVEISDSSLQPIDNVTTGSAIETPVMRTNLAVDFAGGTGTEQDPYLVSTQDQLDNVRNNLDKYFKQTSTITLKVTTWNAGKGWAPIGAQGTEFKGSYDGNSFTINKLYINRPAEDNVGLFGILGDGAKLSNIALDSAIVIGQGKVGGLAGTTVADEENASAACVEITNCRVSGSISGGDGVGGLIGAKFATAGEISNCSTTTTISGKNATGGLIGQNNGPIKNVYSTGVVVGTTQVGGLIGRNESGSASIIDSHSSGGINGSDYVGGLVGYNNAGIIETSYATGATSSTGGSYGVGGLVGYAKGGLTTRTYATGAVTGAYGSMGGLIGINDSGQIMESYASGNVAASSSSSSNFAGGLIGKNSGTGLVSESYATGSVNLTKGSAYNYSYAGGLIGYNYGNTGISLRDSYAVGKVTGVTGYNGSYSSYGGVIGARGSDTSIISGAYYDKTTTGQSDTTKGSVPKTTEEMKQQASFEGWDFNNTWMINEGTSYPELQWKTANSGSVTGVTLNKSSLNLTAGGPSATLIATVSPAEATNKSVTWQSDKPAVATVDSNGQVKPVATGTAKITATSVDGNKSALCTVTVTAAIVNVTSVSLNKHSLTLTVDMTETLQSTITPANATNQVLVWASNDNTVATVDATGVVKAIGLGQARITLTSADGGKTDYCDVEVKNPDSVLAGDANSDGKVTIMDAVKIARSLVGLETLTDSQNSAADFNVDGRVTIMDAQAIAKYLVNK